MTRIGSKDAVAHAQALRTLIGESIVKRLGMNGSRGSAFVAPIVGRTKESLDAALRGSNGNRIGLEELLAIMALDEQDELLRRLCEMLDGRFIRNEHLTPQQRLDAYVAETERMLSPATAAELRAKAWGGR